jgi:hypothetical protein
MRPLDRLLLVLRAPRARSRAAYRVLVAISMPSQHPARDARVVLPSARVSRRR